MLESTMERWSDKTAPETRDTNKKEVQSWR